MAQRGGITRTRLVDELGALEQGPVSDGRPTAEWLARQITEAFPWDSGLTFHSGRMRPARTRSSGSETLSLIRSLAGYTIDMHESDFSEATNRQRPGSNILRL
jgi:hypothetical protein